MHFQCIQRVCSSCPGVGGVVLKPNPAFMPKIVNSIIPLEFRAFYLPPFASSEQQKLNALCPVCPLRIYTERIRGFRECDQLFISWEKPQKGKPITKQRVLHWIVELISLAYSSNGLVYRIQDICEAASWSSPHTFARFYKPVHAQQYMQYWT